MVPNKKKSLLLGVFMMFTIFQISKKTVHNNFFLKILIINNKNILQKW